VQRKALVFGDDAESLRATVAAHADQLADPATLWVAYLKGNRADINRDGVWPDPGRARPTADRTGLGGRGLVGAPLPPTQAG
jgi:poly(3-hydroxybutyrate) depolymerase